MTPSPSRAFVEKTVQGWNSPLRVDLAMFQGATFTICGNPKKVISTDNSTQLTLRFTWQA